MYPNDTDDSKLFGYIQHSPVWMFGKCSKQPNNTTPCLRIQFFSLVLCDYTTDTNCAQHNTQLWWILTSRSFISFGAGAFGFSFMSGIFMLSFKISFSMYPLKKKKKKENSPNYYVHNFLCDVIWCVYTSVKIQMSLSLQ